MLGTPAAGEEEDEKDLTVPIRPLNPGRRSSEILKPSGKSPPVENQKMQAPNLAPKPQASQPNASPTKSILLTPGTAAARRKTVSFGEGVVDNERKRVTDDNDIDIEPVPLSGNISRQWNSSTNNASKRNRSKLTQSLLDAREQKPAEENNELFDINGKGSVENTAVEKRENEEHSLPSDDEEYLEGDDDDTTNLNAPRSRSGLYWKSEFESYRTKTEREIRKLIQYRSVAKSYARKKETEALRLADKLKQEETKAIEMERRVSELAAGMMGDANAGELGKDDIVRELSQQTALALQYKKQVNHLRKTLERQGVVDSGNDAQDLDSPSDNTTKKLRKMEEALEQAHSQLRIANQNTDMKDLRELVEKSEQKATELEKENQSLKRSLARFKDEMSKYEDRRKAKETKLKQREQKMESRVREYSTRLKSLSKSRSESEEVLKQSFATERKQMQEMIDFLRHKLDASENPSSGAIDLPVRSRPAAREYSPPTDEGAEEILNFEGEDDERVDIPLRNQSSYKDMTQKRAHRQSNKRDNYDSYRVNPKYHQNIADIHNSKPTKAHQPLTEVDEDPLITIESPPRASKPLRRRSSTYRRDASAPSSNSQKGQDIQSAMVAPERSAPKQRHSTYTTLSSNGSKVYIPSNRVGLTIHSRKPKYKSFPGSNGSNLQNPRVTINSDSNRQLSLAADGSILSRMEALSPERAASAKLRLKQRKMEARLARVEGKENICVA